MRLRLVAALAVISAIALPPPALGQDGVPMVSAELAYDEASRSRMLAFRVG